MRYFFEKFVLFSLLNPPIEERGGGTRSSAGRSKVMLSAYGIKRVL